MSGKAPESPGNTQTDCHTSNSTTEQFGDGFPFSGVTEVFPRTLGWWRRWWCTLGLGVQCSPKTLCSCWH